MPTRQGPSIWLGARNMGLPFATQLSWCLERDVGRRESAPKAKVKEERGHCVWFVLQQH